MQPAEDITAVLGVTALCAFLFLYEAAPWKKAAANAGRTVEAPPPLPPHSPTPPPGSTPSEPDGTERMSEMFTSGKDWDPFTPAELAVLAKVHERLGPALADVPVDLLAQFVRSAPHTASGEPCVGERLEAALAWRAREGVDQLVQAPPVGRDEFEWLMPAGCVGHDREGRPVILERPGRDRQAVLAALAAMSAEEFVRQQVCSKECIRHFLGAASRRRGRRISKFVSVIDAGGIGRHHFDRRNVAFFKAFAEVSSANYPDCLERLFVVRAPYLMTALWALLRPLLHPVTAAKVSILGGDYAAALEADGVSLPSGKLPESDELEGWVASTRRLLAAARAEAGESPSLAEGVLPPADARAIRQLLAAPRATPATRRPSPRERAPPAEVAKGEGAPLDSLCRKEEQEARLAPASVLVGPVHATVDSAAAWLAALAARLAICVEGGGSQRSPVPV